MIKKIIHCSDIHIRNIKRHEEYYTQLDKFINECKEISKDYSFDEIRIVICGDLFHQKIQTSNEQSIMLSYFLRELVNVAPVIIIAGNHDFMESNFDRIDSLTPIVKMLELKNLTYLDMNLNYKSGYYIDDNIVWCLYSIFDSYKIPDFKICKVDNPDKKFIGLFHGGLSGSKTDAGYEFDHGVSLDIFDGLNACLCGDIHKRQELNYKDIKAVYPGSLIMQEVGETVSRHGFLIWDVESLEYEEIDIESEYGFYKFRISSIEEAEQGTEEFVNF